MTMTNKGFSTATFDALRKKQQDCFEYQLECLKETCEEHPDINEFVLPIVAFGIEAAYGKQGTPEARVGRELLDFIWDISDVDICNLGNDVYFDPSWIQKLNSFIGNYFLDDSGFKLEKRKPVFQFKPSGPSDCGVDWLQDPKVLVAAAKANCAYFDKYTAIGVFDLAKSKIYADQSEVDKLLEPYRRN